MFRIGRIEITTEKSQKEIQIAYERYNKRPDTWSGNESLGRVLYYMADPSASKYIERAIQIRLPMVQKNGGRGWELMIIGNYYRLLGDLSFAQQYFGQAYDAQLKQTGNMKNLIEMDLLHLINYTELQHLIKICFLLEQYDEVVTYGRIYSEEEPDSTLTANTLATLAEAKINGDIAIVDSWIESVEKQLFRNAGRGYFSETGGVDGLDIYEVVLEMLLGMEEKSA